MASYCLEQVQGKRTVQDSPFGLILANFQNKSWQRWILRVCDG
ncbi:MAG: hypothetical protein ACK5EO_04170 [Planctomycetota bacterium]|jgi:hypothetical protein